MKFFLVFLSTLAVVAAQDCSGMLTSSVAEFKANINAFEVKSEVTGHAIFSKGTQTDDKVIVQIRAGDATRFTASVTGNVITIEDKGEGSGTEISGVGQQHTSTSLALLLGATGCFALEDNTAACVVATSCAMLGYSVVSAECTSLVEVEFIFPESGDFMMGKVQVVLPSSIPLTKCPEDLEVNGSSCVEPGTGTNPPSGGTTPPDATSPPDRPDVPTKSPLTAPPTLAPTPSPTNPPAGGSDAPTAAPPTPSPTQNPDDAPARPTGNDFSPKHYLALGDWGSTPDKHASVHGGSYCSTRAKRCSNAQANIGRAMAKWMDGHPSEFILSHGDLFYWNGISYASDPRFEANFENIYSQEAFHGVPWYNVLGNHDVGGASGICSPSPNAWVGLHNGRWCHSDAEMEEWLTKKAEAIKNYSAGEGSKVTAETDGRFNGRFQFGGVYYKTVDSFPDPEGGADLTVEVFHIDTNAAATRAPETCCQCFAGTKNALSSSGVDPDHNQFWERCGNVGDPNLTVEQRAKQCQPDTPNEVNALINNIKLASETEFGQNNGLTDTAEWSVTECKVEGDEKCQPRSKCLQVLGKWWEDGMAQLQTDLAASTADWKIVHNHYMINSAVADKHFSVAQNAQVNQILKAGGVDIFIGGHTHAEGHDFDPNTGVHYLLNGGGGGKDIEGGFGNIWNSQLFGFMTFEFNKEWTRLRVWDDIGTNLHCYDIPSDHSWMEFAGPQAQHNGFAEFNCPLQSVLGPVEDFLPIEN